MIEDSVQHRDGTSAGHRDLVRIEEDHDALREYLRALATATDRATLLSGLTRLSEVLSEHFAEEEGAGGLYDDLLSRSPNLASRLDALRDQHGELLESLEALKGRLQGEIDAVQMKDDAATSLSHALRLVERLRRHEHVESEMIASVYYSDEGGHG